MITGVVNAQLEPTVQLPLHDASGQSHDVEVIVDSGYNGSLTLPPARVTALGLPWVRRLQIRLADGSIQAIDLYRATVIWDGQPRPVEVDVVDAPPLVGTALLQGYELRVRFVVGGLVTIEAIP